MQSAIIPFSKVAILRKRVDGGGFGSFLPVFIVSFGGLYVEKDREGILSKKSSAKGCNLRVGGLQ